MCFVKCNEWRDRRNKRGKKQRREDEVHKEEMTNSKINPYSTKVL